MLRAREFHSCQEPLCWQRALHKEHFCWILCIEGRKKINPCSQEKGLEDMMRLVTATSTLKLIGHVRDVVLALDLGLHISLIPRPSS